MRLSISGDEWDRAWGTLLLGAFLLGTSVATWNVAGDRQAAASLLGIVGAVGVALGGLLLARGLVRVVRIQGAGIAPLLHRPARTARCPRCAVHHRDDSGWCPSCWATLRLGALPSSHPSLRLVDALNAHDVEGAVGWFDDCHLDHQWCRRAPGRDAHIQRAFLRRLLRWFPDYAVRVEVATPDPVHPGVAWLRLAGTGRLRILGVPQQRRQIFRCHTEADRITETWSFRPLI